MIKAIAELNKYKARLNTVLSEMINEDYLIRVRDYMPVPLPRPRLKRRVFVTGWGEWLPLVEVSW